MPQPPAASRHAHGHVLVQEADIRAFAAATNDDGITYYGHDAISPPMMHARLMHGALAAAMAPSGPGVEALSVLHQAHDVRFFGVLRPGDVVAIRRTQGAPQSRRRGLRQAAQLQGFHAGRLAIDAHTAFFFPGAGDAPADTPPVALEPPPGAAPDSTLDWVIDRDQAVRYAAASLDHNPIHLDPEAARSVGLEGPILHGLCTLAMAAQGVLKRVGWNDARSVRRIAGRFRRPVAPGAALRTHIWRQAEGARFQVEDAAGQVVLADGRLDLADPQAR